MRYLITLALVAVSGCYAAPAQPQPSGVSYMSLLVNVYDARDAQCERNPGRCFPSAELTPTRVTCVERIDLGASEEIVARQADAMADYADCLRDSDGCALAESFSTKCTTKACADEMLRIDAEAIRCLDLP